MNGQLKRCLKRLLSLAGKSKDKVVAVFAHDLGDAHTLVAYLHQQTGLPIWLFSTAIPSPETARICHRVTVRDSGLALLIQAERELWPHTVALCAAAWTGAPTAAALKLVPFLIPPFRALLLNQSGDVFTGTWSFVFGRVKVRVRIAFAGMVASARGRLATFLEMPGGIWRSGPCNRVKDVLTAVGLLTVASILKWFGYPHRRLFPLLHGHSNQHVSPFLERSIDRHSSGVVRFEQSDHCWRADEFQRLATSTEARWIVWHTTAADPSIKDLLPLFDDPLTFAVARQQHWRAWNPTLLPMAPFRPLQTGEVSRVLAPIADTILIDRQKLLALGIPRDGLAVSAWLTLFWKAAATGWHSYSVGTGAATEQPDYPVAEVEFFLRVIANHELRALAPVDPELARGNIAFIPAGERRRSDRLTVLVVSPFLPYPLSHGGAVRMYNLCSALCDRVDFVLVAVRESHDVVDYGELQRVFHQVHVVDIDERGGTDTTAPEAVRQYRSASLRALIADLCRTLQPDLVQFEYSHLAELREAAEGIPAVLVEHDLTFALHRQLATTPAAVREYQRWLQYERRWWPAYDAVWTMSDHDRDEAIANGSDADRTFTIPNGVDVTHFGPRNSPTNRPEVLYVGSFRHLPNVMGFERLRDEIMPRIWQSIPDAKLRVVAGMEHERFWRTFARNPETATGDAKVETFGFVEDLRPMYESASVVVAPLEVSAGTNIKVLEALACGKAIVTTSAGCAGLGLVDGYDALIRNDWTEFARAVAMLLADPELCSKLGTCARQTAVERFSWNSIQERAWQSYMTVLGRSVESDVALADAGR